MIHDQDKKVTPTEVIIVDDLNESEEDLKLLSKEELLHRLNFEETDPEKIKLIKKVLKNK